MVDWDTPDVYNSDAYKTARQKIVEKGQQTVADEKALELMIGKFFGGGDIVVMNAIRGAFRRRFILECVAIAHERGHSSVRAVCRRLGDRESHRQPDWLLPALNQIAKSDDQNFGVGM